MYVMVHSDPYKCMFCAIGASGRSRVGAHSARRETKVAEEREKRTKAETERSTDEFSNTS